MKSPVYQPKYELSLLFISSNGVLYADPLYIIDGVAGMERNNIVFNVYFLTY